MKKYFVVSDVHGFFYEFVEALKEKGFEYTNPEHILISCGDLLDRGRYPRQVLNYVMNLPEERRILICGNHEDLIEDALRKGYFEDYDYHNGPVNTVYDLVCDSELDCNLANNYYVTSQLRKDDLYNEYISSCVDFYDLGKYKFVHGWIPGKYDSWYDARWLNGMNQWKNGKGIPGVTIVCGHWSTNWGHFYLHGGDSENYDIFRDDGIIALDGCTVITNKVNVLVLDEDDIG